MKPETQKKFLQALDRLYSSTGRAMGLDGYDAVMQYLVSNIKEPGVGQEMVREMLVDVGAQKHGLTGERVNEIYSGIDSRQKLLACLAELPEPEPATLEWFLAAAKAVPLQLRTGLLPLAKKLPHRAGKNSSLTPEEAEAVCEQIKMLMANGIGTKEAQRQIAGRMSLSLRTIQRIYSKRK